MPELVLSSNNVQLPSSEHPVPASIQVDCASGKIIAVHSGKIDKSTFHEDTLFYDFGDLYVLPGLVDPHVHLNEPGRTDWEGFYTGTKAAIAGGFTTVVDMPLNSIPPTTTVDNLQLKRQAARGQCWSDVAFWGGVIPRNQGVLLSMIEAGVKGFKCFLIESGVEEFPHVSEHDVMIAMEALESSSLPTVLQFHAELDVNSASKSDIQADPTLYSTFLASRPDSLEVAAIDLVISLAKSHPTLRTHIVHLASAKALPIIRAAKAAGLPITVETCFHYLCLDAASIPSGRPEFKCCPPIRDANNREQLWEALIDGTIDFVVSDHSPCIESLKRFDTGDIMQAWGGIGGLGLGLSLLWTECQKRGINMSRIVDWLSTKTAEHASLQDRKGTIAVGKDADFVVFDPDAQYTVTKETFHFKNAISPYEGMTLTGEVKKTFLRGTLVFDNVQGREEQMAPRIASHFEKPIEQEDTARRVQGKFPKDPIGVLL